MTLVRLDQHSLEVVGIVGSRGPNPEQGRDTGWGLGATNYNLVLRLVARIQKLRHENGELATIVSGGAPSGVDFHVMLACRSLGFCFGEHLIDDPTSVDCHRDHFHELPAWWHGKDGKSPFNRLAGFERNGRLVRHCTLVLALFAPGERTPGTSDVIKKCREFKVPVLVYHEGNWNKE